MLAKLVSLHYPKMRTKASTEDFMKYLYWAAAGITFLINIGFTTQSLTHQYTNNHPSITSCIIQVPNHPCTIPSGTSVYNDEVLTLVAKCTIIPVAVFMELLISVYIVKNNYGTRQERIGFRCSSVKHYLPLSFHILALWNILTAVQLFTMHDCYPTGCTATNPPASYYRVCNNCATNISWFSTHCCLCAVSVSTTKKEKFPEHAV